jgi:molybdopterin-synthase adenylyltransferase
MSKDRYSRQSFLGANSQECIEQVTVGIVGLGGGGSHIVQQLAHVGFLNFIIFDPQKIDQSNLNRMVGATQADVAAGSLKIDIAQKIIGSIQPNASMVAVADRWQKFPKLLRQCDIIFGCVDTYKERAELEASARRYFIPYIDIGMDVFQVEDEPPRMAGQVILSMPNSLCLRCFGFITDDKLGQEASKYGAVGGRPQVIWPNGMLASAAVGIAVDLVTGWTNQDTPDQTYLSLDGNDLTFKSHPCLDYDLPKECIHYPISQAGDPDLMTI